MSHQKPITLVVLHNEKTIAESSNFTGYIPRQGELIRISYKFYKILRVYWSLNDACSVTEAVTLIVEQKTHGA